jgi:hypothetical protein
MEIVFRKFGTKELADFKENSETGKNVAASNTSATSELSFQLKMSATWKIAQKWDGTIAQSDPRLLSIHIRNALETTNSGSVDSTSVQWYPLVMSPMNCRKPLMGLRIRPVVCESFKKKLMAGCRPREVS